MNFSYSYYSIKNKEVVEAYEVPDQNSLLAIPSHKASLIAKLKLTRHLSFNPTVLWLGERYGYTSYDTAGDPVLEKFSPSLLANLFICYDGLFVKGLDIGLGVYDILNTKTQFIQPYSGDHAPLPGPSREIVFRLSYNLNFNE